MYAHVFAAGIGFSLSILLVAAVTAQFDTFRVRLAVTDLRSTLPLYALLTCESGEAPGTIHQSTAIFPAWSGREDPALGLFEWTYESAGAEPASLLISAEGEVLSDIRAAAGGVLRNPNTLSISIPRPNMLSLPDFVVSIDGELNGRNLICN